MLIPTEYLNTSKIETIIIKTAVKNDANLIDVIVLLVFFLNIISFNIYTFIKINVILNSVFPNFNYFIIIIYISYTHCNKWN